MKKNNGYILWLPSWYPNKLEPYNGDFIQRHAKAAALYNSLYVVHVIRDVAGSITKGTRKETFENGRLRETIIYYYVSPKKIKFLEKLISVWRYFRLHRQLFREFFKKNGKPDLIHVHIAMKAGIIAWWARKKFKIPYVISEHWTLYLPEASPNIWQLSFFSKRLFKTIFSGAQMVMAVSNYLGKHLQTLYEIPEVIVIPNVVDSNVFNLSDVHGNSETNRFVHISTLGYQKNPEDIIRAFSMVKNKGHKFKLSVIGPDREELIQLVKQHALEKEILFFKEMPQKELAAIMRNADALILYSRYETFGCVIIEANACGLPVIVSDIPVMRENVKEGFNGLFARSEAAELLASKIINFSENKYEFDPVAISTHTKKKYSYEAIGKQFHDWYTR